MVHNHRKVQELIVCIKWSSKKGTIICL